MKLNPIVGAKNHLTLVEQAVHNLEKRSYMLRPSDAMKNDIDFMSCALNQNTNQMSESDQEYAANVIKWEAASRLKRTYISPSWVIPAAKQERFTHFMNSPDYLFNNFTKFAFADLITDILIHSGLKFSGVYTSSDVDNCFGGVHLFVELQKDEVFGVRIVPSDSPESFMKTNINPTAYPGEFNKVKHLGEKSHPILELHLPVKMINLFLSEYFESVTFFSGVLSGDRTRVIPDGLALFESVASSDRMTQDLISRMKTKVAELAQVAELTM